MSKFSSVVFSLFCLTLSTHVSAQEQRYVSDNLNTYIHSGPGNKYRIIGSLNSGDAVTLLSMSDDQQYAQIRDSKGRTSWIPADQLTTTPGLRVRIPELEQQVKTLSDKLNTIDNDWNKRTAEMQQKVAASDGIIHELETKNKQLEKQLVIAEKKVNAANLQLDDKQRTIMQQWFLYGGGVAGFGLLLGLLLPRIIPRRRRDTRWMN